MHTPTVSLVLLLASSAFAQDRVQVTGTLSNTDVSPPTLTTADGTSYRLREWYAQSELYQVSLGTNRLRGLEGRSLTLVGLAEQQDGAWQLRPLELLTLSRPAEPVQAVVVAPGELLWAGQSRRVEAYGPAAALLDESAVGRRVNLRVVLEHDLDSGEVTACYVDSVEARVRGIVSVYDSQGSRTGRIAGCEWLHGVTSDGRVLVHNTEWVIAIVPVPLPVRRPVLRRANRKHFRLGTRVDLEELLAQPTGGPGFSQSLGQ